jgi:putative tryptophan/tyrosine transport system substrate-binding protein
MATHSSQSGVVASRVNEIVGRLRELGYLEGETIVVERRNADGKIDRLPALATELVRLKVAVIITGGPQATRAAKEATSTIPIVMANVGDPGTRVTLRVGHESGFYLAGYCRKFESYAS